MRLELQERNLNELSKKIAGIEEGDILKSHLSKYFCILVSGYIENYIKELVSNYHTKTCKKETAKFVTARTKNLTNLDDAKIIAFLQSFSDNWADQYSLNRSDEMEAALNTVYAQRNKIAHGDASNSNISYKAMFLYYELIKEAMLLLKTIINKN